MKRSIEQLAGNEFIAFNLSPGKHTIELKFRPPGLAAGALISLMAVILLIILCRWGGRITAMLVKAVSMRREALPEPEEFDPEESDYSTEGRDFSPEEEQPGCHD